MPDVEYCSNCGESITSMERHFREDLVLDRYRTEFECPACGFHAEVFRLGIGEENPDLMTDGGGEFRDKLEFRRIEEPEPYRDKYALASKWNAGYPDEHHTIWEGHKTGFIDIFWATMKLAEREHPELIQKVVERNSRSVGTDSERGGDQ